MSRTNSTRTSRIGLDPTINEEGEVDIGASAEVGGRRGSTPRRPPMGGIDLTKGLDLEKPRPPRSGIGIEVGKSPAGNLGVGVEIPLPVPAPISGRGGVSIDPATGKIRGGYGGIGIGKGPIGGSIDVGVDTPPGSDKIGCFKYVTVTLGFFSHTYGKNECEPNPPKPPLGGLNPVPQPPGVGFEINQIIPLLNDNKCYHVVILNHVHISEEFQWKDDPNVFVRSSTGADVHGGGVWTNGANRFYAIVDKPLPYERTPAYIEFHTPPNVPLSQKNDFPAEFQKYKGNFKAWALINNKLQIIIPNGYRYNEISPSIGSISGTGATIKYFISKNRYDAIWDLSVYEIPCSSLPSSPNLPIQVTPLSVPPTTIVSPPIPNPPPKKKMDDCCEITKALQLETLRMLGRQIVGGKLVPVSPVKGFLGEETERIETPIKDIHNPKKVKIKFSTFYEMLKYILDGEIAMDVALDPRGYKVPKKESYLQNPKYQRDSGHSLKENSQPQVDKFGNKRELIVGSDILINSFLHQQQYLFEAFKQYEYLFPRGEFNDFKIDRSLIAPGQSGDMQIHNNFHTLEVLFQYLNSSLGNPREPIHIADTNPGKEGSQPITVTPFSLSHLLREMYKYIIDMEGDQDSQMNLALRDFRTNLANRVQIIQIAEMVKALFEDTGMVEKQDYIKIKLEGDPYAGCFKEGKGFEPSKELDENTEEGTEKLLEATLKNFEMKVKVLKRDNKKDPKDLRDVIVELYNKLIEQQGGTANVSIEDAIKKAEFNVQLDGALTRVNVKKAQTASTYRTRKKRKK